MRAICFVILAFLIVSVTSRSYSRGKETTERHNEMDQSFVKKSLEQDQENTCDEDCYGNCNMFTPGECAHCGCEGPAQAQDEEQDEGAEGNACDEDCYGNCNMFTPGECAHCGCEGPAEAQDKEQDEGTEGNACDEDCYGNCQMFTPGECAHCGCE
ncbi:hypothetical protein OS493_025528 [Desmophyllum pertusum]|uniref:Uncharacterized protein n=1 Tax=Desmophyllum pertusum TaxID=174260 RepID=A0A9W9YD76_9CNID|nr:hypothetical protein OS493_025528 [Desmophyllum pertusum]